MPKIYLSIGSNCDKDIHVPSALERLQTLFGPLQVSSLYESEAVGYTGPVFHNLVVGFESELPPEAIAATLADVETLEGRTREQDKGVPHTLDLDLLLYGNAIINRGKVRVPREDITRYAFVLEPLAELAPHDLHPLTGQSYAKLWEEFDTSTVRQTCLGTIRTF